MSLNGMEFELETGPKLTCGCGFEAQQGNATDNQIAFDRHRCTEEDLPPRWHESVFSFPGLMIVGLITIAVVAVFTS